MMLMRICNVPSRLWLTLGGWWKLFKVIENTLENGLFFTAALSQLVKSCCNALSPPSSSDLLAL